MVQVACMFFAPREIVAWSRMVKKSGHTKMEFKLADSRGYYFLLYFAEVAVLRALQALAPHRSRIHRTLVQCARTALGAALHNCFWSAVVFTMVLLTVVEFALLLVIALGTKIIVTMLAHRGSNVPAAADVEGNPRRGSGAENPLWVPRTSDLCSDVYHCLAAAPQGASVQRDDAGLASDLDDHDAEATEPRQTTEPLQWYEHVQLMRLKRAAILEARCADALGLRREMRRNYDLRRANSLATRAAAADRNQ